LYCPLESSEWATATKKYWNPDVFNNPGNLNYWLDFIDTGSEIGKYSISQIGRRTKVVNSDDIKTLYNKDVPDIIFLKQGDTENIQKYINSG
jgi:hypothetical protein